MHGVGPDFIVTSPGEYFLGSRAIATYPPYPASPPHLPIYLLDVFFFLILSSLLLLTIGTQHFSPEQVSLSSSLLSSFFLTCSSFSF